MGVAQNTGDPPPEDHPQQQPSPSTTMTQEQLRAMRLKAMSQGKLYSESTPEAAPEHPKPSPPLQKLKPNVKEETKGDPPELKKPHTQAQMKQVEDQEESTKSPEKEKRLEEIEGSSPSSVSPSKKKDLSPMEHRDNIMRKIFRLQKREEELYELQDLDSYLISQLQTLAFKETISVSECDQQRPAYLHGCFERLQAMKRITDYISMDEKMDIERTICLYFKHLFVDYEILEFENPIKIEEKIVTQTTQNNMLANLLPPGFQMNPELGHLMEALENGPGFASRSNKVEKCEISLHHRDFLLLLRNTPRFFQKEGFLVRIVEYTIADGGLAEVTMIFEPIFKFLEFELSDLQHKDILNVGRIQKQLALVSSLLHTHPSIAQVFVESESFLKEINHVPHFKQESNLLALPLRISAFPHESREVMQTRCVEVLRTRNPKPIMNSIQKPLEGVLKAEAEIFQFLLHLNERTQKRAMDWLRGLANFNLGKLKMYGGQEKYSSDSFLINTITLVLKIFKEYLDSFGKGLAVDFNYALEFSPARINLNSPNIVHLQKRKEVLERRMLKHEKEAEESKEKLSSSTEESLPTQLFFVIHTLLHEFEPFLSKTYIRNQRTMEQKLNQNLPKRVAMDIHMQAPLLVEGLFAFMGFTSYKLLEDCVPLELKAAFPSPLTQENLLNLLQIPTNADIAENVAVLPTLVLQNIKAYSEFYAQVNPLCFPQQRENVDAINAMFLVSMGSEELVTSPHLRAQFIFFIAVVLPRESKGGLPNPHNKKRNEIFEQIFVRNQFMVHHGIQIFFKLFSDVERTGQDNEFYEKFQFRNLLCQILHYFLKKSGENAFQEKFIVDICERSKETFVKYCTYILNDLIYFTDQIFEKLTRVREIEDQETTAPYDMQAVIQRQHEKATLEKRLTIENELINIMIKLLKDTVQLNPKAFEAQEVLEKFATAVNYTVDVLVTKKGVKLKVNNPQKYKFQPVKLLTSYVKIYVAMAHSQKFKEEVVKDQRAYSDEMFQKILKLIFLKHKIPRPARFIPLKELAVELSELKRELVVEEDFFEDAPDQFRDALMDTIMENPVLLPSSKAVVDYLTISKKESELEKHLINVEEDPFNREKLTLDMVQEMPDLKLQIQNYKKQKKSKHE